VTRRLTAPLLGVVATFALTAVGCRGEAEVAVRAMWDPVTPIVELEVTALPFDPDRVLDSLTLRATSPAPSFADLEEEIRAYRPPNDERVETATRPWRALRDTVQVLADSLNTVGRSAPGYAEQYGRFRRLYERLAQLATERDAQLRRLSGGQLDLARRATTAAESLRAWEYEAFASYGDVAAAEVLRTGRDVVEAATDYTGQAVFRLAPGRWWLVARHPDPQNPFLEYYWNMPVTVTGTLPVRLPLGVGRSESRWRH